MVHPVASHLPFPPTAEHSRCVCVKDPSGQSSIISARDTEHNWVLYLPLFPASYLSFSFYVLSPPWPSLPLSLFISLYSFSRDTEHNLVLYLSLFLASYLSLSLSFYVLSPPWPSLPLSLSLSLFLLSLKIWNMIGYCISFSLSSFSRDMEHNWVLNLPLSF